MSRNRIKRTICAALGALALLGMLGVIGGMEFGTIRIMPGTAIAFGLELAGAVLLAKGGVIRFE